MSNQRMSSFNYLSKGALITSLLTLSNVIAQVSAVEGIPPLEGVPSIRQPNPMNESQREDKFWDDVKNVGNKEAFEAYINAYPKGRYVNIAKANLSQLKANNASASKKESDAELGLKVFKLLLMK